MKLLFGIVAGALALAGAAHAQGSGPGGYPNKPVKIIVPFAPAGPTDIAARLIATKLTDSLKQQFFVENVAGAGGNIGMGQAAKSAPDGYTILFVSSSYVVNPSLYDKVPYDPYKDFRPLTVAATAANVLLVNPKVIQVDSPKALADHVKANPGKYTFASAGTGTTPHLSGEIFKLTFKLDTVHVPFGGAGPAIQSIIAGHTPLAFTSLPPAVPHIKAGTLRALAVANNKRVADSAGGSDARRGRHSRSGGGHVPGRSGAGGRAEGSRRLSLSGGREGGEVAGRHRQDGAAWPRDHLQHAGAVHTADQERDRQVGQGDQGREHQAAVTSFRGARLSGRTRNPDARQVRTAGFRAPRHSASKTRVNALMARSRNDDGE